MQTEREFRWIPFVKWHELLERAQLENVRLTPIKRARRLMYATSGATGRVAYTVDEFGCSCPAGRNGVDCKHRALYLFTHFARLTAAYGYPTEMVESGAVGEEYG